HDRKAVAVVGMAREDLARRQAESNYRRRVILPFPQEEVGQSTPSPLQEVLETLRTIRPELRIVHRHEGHISLLLFVGDKARREKRRIALTLGSRPSLFPSETLDPLVQLYTKGKGRSQKQSDNAAAGNVFRCSMTANSGTKVSPEIRVSHSCSKSTCRAFKLRAIIFQKAMAAVRSKIFC